MMAPANRTQVWAVRFASRSLPSSHVYLNHHFYREPSEELTLDYFVWIVRTPDRTILVDTGFSPAAAARRARASSRTPMAALAEAGIAPSDVDRVVITHCHFDHTGNLGAFPRADFVLAAAEYDFWTGPIARRPVFAAWAEESDLRTLCDLRDQGRMSLVQDRMTVAPGVEVTVVGGHTPGQAIVTVHTGAGVVVLASDAVHTYAEFDLDRPFLLVADLPRMLLGYDLIRGLMTQPGAVLVPGHDPLVMTRFPSVAADTVSITPRLPDCPGLRGDRQ